MIEPLAATLVPLCVFGITAAAVFVRLKLWWWQIGKRNRRTPLTKQLLRSPGNSLREALHELEQNNAAWLAFTLLMPFFAYSIGSTSLLLDLQAAPPRTHWELRIAGIAIALATALIFFIRKLFANFETIRNLRLGMEGEVATGEELNQLMLHGCRVFHDVPFDYGNIDHVVVSKSGVFAIETKTRSKSNESSVKVTIDYNNDGIRFSDQNWRFPIDQLETQARWLGKHLTQATAMTINVEAMLALPGYFIENSVGERKSVLVFNPVNASQFFVNGSTVFDNQQVQRIAHQVEQLCRDVKPSFGAKNETFRS